MSWPATLTVGAVVVVMFLLGALPLHAVVALLVAVALGAVLAGVLWSEWVRMVENPRAWWLGVDR